MVGFGSSLRMARRSGWENAYFDYETLKLLLSQIESVYEEEWHRQQQQQASIVDSSKTTNKNAQRTADYRDELFLESDSDIAFASSASDVIPDEMSSSSSSTDNEHHQRRDSKLFTLTYSQEASESSNDDSSVDLENSCATALGWSSGSKKYNKVVASSPVKKLKKKHKRRILETPGEHDNSEFYVGDAFLMEGDTTTATTTAATGTTSAAAQYAYGGQTEQSGLLQQSQASSQGGTFFSFHTRDPSITPPRDWSGNAQYPQKLSLGVPSQQQGLPNARSRPTAAEIRREKLDQERKRKRRQRRRRKLLKKRQELERRVPRHLRSAHKKARSITERFLGLLRAEVEKVTLFAQSRLGELADTAGSLRFPSYEDSEYGSFSSHSRHRAGGSYEHPLSDGGLHPSASSSEDEGYGDRRSTFPWSDSSDEAENSDSVAKGARSPTYGPVEKTLSGGTFLSASTLHHYNRSEPPPARQESTGTKKAKKAARDATERKIAHYTKIRRAQPVFQRNDDIVGEDLLLLSAVDEADGYTTVGVELMHVLRYICVNAIAVRKICRKHDRLLMNRMLGGYYHRRNAAKKTSRKAAAATSEMNKHSLTLGSIVCRSVGENCRVDPASVSATNQNKLVGVYDREVQELANSTTVQVISSCVALALSEYEVTRSRADALSKLKSVPPPLNTPRMSGASRSENSSQGIIASFGLTPSRWLSSRMEDSGPAETEVPLDSDDEGGPPSTTSSVSLSRLRFTVVSIFALREAAREKIDVQEVFLSRSLLAFVGPNIVGEGLDGCSRAVLDFFVCYNPDAALLLDSSDIYRGLHEDEWRNGPIGSVMLSSLAMAVTPPTAEFSGAGDIVLSAVSIKPTCVLRSKVSMEKQVSEFLAHSKLSIVPNITTGMIVANRLSLLLQTINYYIIHATANTFVTAAGASPAHSAIVIGGTSLGALLAASLHSHAMSKETAGIGDKFVYGFYRHALTSAALLSLLGNILYIIAIVRSSVPLAVMGRLLLGCGSADLLYRQLAGSLPDPCVLVESARLAKFQIIGVLFGLLLGALLASFGSSDVPFGSSLESSSYLMVALWSVQLVHILVALYRNVELPSSMQRREGEEAAQLSDSQHSQFSSDDSEAAIPVENDSKLIYQTTDLKDEEAKIFSAEDARIPLTYSPARDTPKGRSIFRVWRITTIRLKKYIMCNMALPVTLVLVVFTTLTHEILFTASPIITNRYFGWSGSHAGLLLGCLSVFVFLIKYVCGSIANTWDERTVIKRSVWLIGLGFVIMINYMSLFKLASQVPSLLVETTNQTPVSYDWIFGIFQYLIGFGLTFTGFTAMEGASLALMSKVAPTNVRSVAINCGTIVTFASLAARFLGDVEICMVGLSHRMINTDIMNSLVIPLLLLCVAAGYIVKRHFFFLL